MTKQRDNVRPKDGKGKPQQTDARVSKSTEDAVKQLMGPEAVKRVMKSKKR